MRQSFGRWERGASLVAIAALLTGAPAMAQDDQAEGEAAPSSSVGSADEGADPADDDVIVVRGLRQALDSAQQRKRNADTVIDSISATDIGAFPDKSVAEALQRVPGISVSRFAINTDTAHFTTEPSGVLVRGLPQVRSEFNGRDTFSATGGRALSWGDVPVELLGGVDVYKNQTADLIEGGIAGSVNLRTRLPFDSNGQLIQAGVRANYGDIAKKITPDASVYYSNRWDSDVGEFGLMGSVAYSHVKSGSQGLQSYRAGIFTQGMIPGSDDAESIFGPGAVVPEAAQELAGDAVRVANQHARASARATKRALGHGDVVVHEVELADPGFGDQQLRRMRDDELAAIDAQGDVVIERCHGIGLQPRPRQATSGIRSISLSSVIGYSRTRTPVAL